MLSDLPSGQQEQVSELLPTKAEQIDATPDIAATLAKLENTEMEGAEFIAEKRRKTDLSVFKFYLPSSTGGELPSS